MGKLGKECYPNETCDKGLRCDTDNNVCIEDPENPINDSDRTDSGSDVEPDTGSDSDGSDSAPDSGDSQPDDTDTAYDGGDTALDNGDTADDSDNGDTMPDNGDLADDSDDSDTGTNPDTNLPECSPESATPCIDAETDLIWSGKSPERLRWIDAVEYCNKLNEGGFNDWRLPSWAVLRSLVQNCKSSSGCTGDSDGTYSKFGDIVFLWSSTEYGSSQAIGIYFYNAAAQLKNVDESFDLRCVRREAESRQSSCTGLIENSVWNTTSQITQTWDWGEALWLPSQTGSYSEEPSTTECRFKCEDNYCWWGAETGCTDKKSLGNICTGQTSCYDASSSMTCPTSESADFYGQDAYYASLGKCTPQSFTVQTISSQNMVVDNNTGLMWQQTVTSASYALENAKTYCSNLTYAGYSDWRLPKPRELLTIIDNSRYHPAIDTSYFPDAPSGYFWSSSQDGDYAWRVYFNYGSVDYNLKSVVANVRCVRGESLPQNYFNSSTVNGDVIVTDTSTGLIWQKTYETEKSWQQALDYCKKLTYAGYSDWRLPNKNELASLVYHNMNPASDFPDMPSAVFWSSSTQSDYTDNAWYVDFFSGSVGNVDKTKNDMIYVRCVRN